MSEWRDTEMRPTPCPSCGRENDMACHVGGQAVPKPGDVTICIGCAAANIFTDDLGQRAMTAADTEAMSLHDYNELNNTILRIRAALRAAKAAEARG